MICLCVSVFVCVCIFIFHSMSVFIYHFIDQENCLDSICWTSIKSLLLMRETDRTINHHLLLLYSYVAWINSEPGKYLWTCDESMMKDFIFFFVVVVYDAVKCIFWIRDWLKLNCVLNQSMNRQVHFEYFERA